MAGVALPRLKRVIAWDALRVLAIATVVLIHTLMPYRELLPERAPVRVFDDLLHYAVPLFVFISGALLWGRPWHPGPGVYRHFLTRRARLIGLPFLAWSALYLGLRAAGFGEQVLHWADAPELLVIGHVWYHLYFVPMLLTFYALTPVAVRVRRLSPELLLAACYALRILGGPEIADALGEWFGPAAWSYATHVVTHLPHMALGAWFSCRYHALPRRLKRAWALPLIVGTAVLLGASLRLTAELPELARRLVYPGGMGLTVLGLAGLAFNLELWLERFGSRAERAGALAFGVFFVHPIYLLAIDGIVAAGPGDALWLKAWVPAVVFCAVTLASFATARALASHGSTAWLVGLEAPI